MVSLLFLASRRVALFACALAACFLLCPQPVMAADEEKKLSVGFVYVSVVSDMAWSWSHDQGRKALEEAGLATTTFVENIPEGPDGERVMLNLSRRGCDIIFTTSFGYMDSTIKIAKQFPGIQYFHCSGYKTAENVSVYFGRMYQSRYLTGMIAGGMTKSNIIGYVAAHPIPEVIRGINAFTLGARSVNPDAEVRVVWTRTWYGPTTEKEAARSLLDVGADVLAQHLDSSSTQEVAQARGAWSIGYNTDMTRFAPDAHLVSAVWNWVPYYVRVVEQIRQGTWEQENFWGGMDTGIVDISDISPNVPQELRERVLKSREAIIAGDMDVFYGPIRDQGGNLRVAEGVWLTEQEMLSMDWFVEGVRGVAK